MKHLKLPTQERLKELFDYNPETGDFTRIVSVYGRNGKAGNIAGSKMGKGYISISVDGKLYQAHRLAWMYMTGEDLGELQIDHKNQKKNENWIGNLRKASNGQNQANTPAYSNNSTGYKGVSYHKTKCKYGAAIQVNKKQKHLGYFDTPEEASAAYQEEAMKLTGEFYCE